MEIIHKMANVIKVIKSKNTVDIVEFQKYCWNLYLEYLEKYSWFPLTPTVHKILIHGPFIMENFLVPTGELSEEAQESRNKYFKMYKKDFSRKISRVAANEDCLHRSTLTSDPVLNKFRKLKMDSEE